MLAVIHDGLPCLNLGHFASYLYAVLSRMICCVLSLVPYPLRAKSGLYVVSLLSPFPVFM